MLVASAVLFAGSAACSQDTGWTGFYAGGHLGLLFSTTDFTDPNGPPIYGGSVSAGGVLIGGQAGYNWQAAPQWVLGVEGEFSFLSAYGSNTCQQPNTTIVGSNCKIMPRQLATLAGRAGFLTEPGGKTMLYGKAGVAWLNSDRSINPNNPPPVRTNSWTLMGEPEQGAPATSSGGNWGPIVGAGFEHAFSPRWSLKGEYSYARFTGVNLAAPNPTDVAEDNVVTNLTSGGNSYLTQNLHLAKVGLNYRFGGPSRNAAEAADWAARTPDEPPWSPGWEFDVGTRFWYSSGRYQNQNGGENSLVSRLTYNGVVGQSGELFGRIDSPYNIFVKGLVGAGGLSRGSMYDEDWGLGANLTSIPTSYEVTNSDVFGTLHYITGDIGYTVWRGRDHKVGAFVGYNRYETVMNAMGCAQLVSFNSGVCSPPMAGNGITQYDTWQSVRLGVAAEALLWKKLKVGVDLAWLPFVKYNGLDIHRARDLYFPSQGTGTGVQGEIVFNWMVTEQFGIGIGGRYWTMWATNTMDVGLFNGINYFPVETDRYGVFLQASYKFTAPR